MSYFLTLGVVFFVHVQFCLKTETCHTVEQLFQNGWLESPPCIFKVQVFKINFTFLVKWLFLGSSDAIQIFLVIEMMFITQYIYL